jgi:hypothetical protein
LPISTSAEDINAEIGNSISSIVDLNATAVRNLANIASGAISFENCRWGIAVPNRSIFQTGQPQISNSAETSLTAFALSGGGPPVTSRAIVGLVPSSDLFYRTENGSFGQSEFLRSWLIIGSNNDYTIRFDVTSGFLDANSDQTGIDLSFAETRSWEVTATGGPASSSATGNLILKRFGTTVITRPISLQAFTED